MNKKWLIPTLIPLMSACVSLDPGFQSKTTEYFDLDAPPEPQEIDYRHVPGHALNQLVKGVAYDLMESNEYATPRTPVAVTSFVNLETLEDTNWLGNQIQESFMHELHLHGLTVVDFKTTGSIRVTKTGDFSLTRDWQELQNRHIIDYVVTGTMNPQDDGLMLNVRMVGMQSRVVVATAQAFIPDWVIGGTVNKLRKVDMMDGLVIRDEKNLAAEKRAISLRR